MNQGKKISGIVLTVIGSIFLFVACALAAAFCIAGGAMRNQVKQEKAQLQELSDRAVMTQGYVLDADNATTVAYYSKSDDAYYEVTYSVSSSSFQKGDQVDVYYDRDDPGSCMVPDLVEGTYQTLGTVFTALGAGIGIFFGSIGLGLLIGGIVLIRKARPTYEN